MSDVPYSFMPLLTVTGQRVVLNLRRHAPPTSTDQGVSRTVDRRISARPRHAVGRRSVENWISSQSQAARQSWELGEVSDTASALELKAMG